MTAVTPVFDETQSGRASTVPTVEAEKMFGEPSARASPAAYQSFD